MKSSSFSVRLFYSYSHKDTQHRESLEEALALLKQDRLLVGWSDASILPGQQIPTKIVAAMQDTDIFVFLLSRHFIASAECRKEWERARSLQADNTRPRVRVPVIVSDCSWRDLLADDDNIKALPADGQAITAFTNPAAAWQQVYEGIKSIVNHLRSNFSPRSTFLDHLQNTDVFSQKRAKLEDLFVFLPLSRYQPRANAIHELEERTVTNVDDLLKVDYSLLHGDDLIGKTALGRHIMLSLLANERPALLVDLETINLRANIDTTLAAVYHEQFQGELCTVEDSCGEDYCIR